MNANLLRYVFLIFVFIGVSQPALAQDAMFVAPNGYVGFGTDTPAEVVHLTDGNLRVEQTGIGVGAELQFATAGSEWQIKQNGVTGRLTFFSPGGGAATASFKFDRQAVENLFRVGVLGANVVDINGKLVINGTDVTPDYIFEPSYPLESIEEHARFMWDNRHLPAMSSASENEANGVDIVAHQYGVLAELEKAHIYIARLNETIKVLEEEVQLLKLARQADAAASGGRQVVPAGGERNLPEVP